jgi:hypothetical protein
MPHQKIKPIEPSTRKCALLLPLAFVSPRFLSGHIRGLNKVRTWFIFLVSGSWLPAVRRGHLSVDLL